MLHNHELIMIFDNLMMSVALILCSLSPCMVHCHRNRAGKVDFVVVPDQIFGRKRSGFRPARDPYVCVARAPSERFPYTQKERFPRQGAAIY
jgi:hypothetical protein